MLNFNSCLSHERTKGQQLFIPD